MLKICFDHFRVGACLYVERADFDVESKHNEHAVVKNNHRTWITAVGLFLALWVIRMGMMRVSLAMCWTWLLLNSGTKAGLTLQKRWLCTLLLCGIILGVFVIIVSAGSDQDHLIYLGPLARISRQAGGRQGYMVGLTLLILHGANFRGTGERFNL